MATMRTDMVTAHILAVTGATARRRSSGSPTPPAASNGTQATGAVTKVTFTGGQIAPGEFQEFELSIGPLPDDVDQITFPTLQTYEAGDVVRWIDPPASTRGTIGIVVGVIGLLVAAFAVLAGRRKTTTS